MLMTYDRRSNKIHKPHLKFKSLRTIAFGNNGKFKQIGLGNIELKSDIIIHKVLLDDKFSFSLPSISQLCNVGYKVKF